MLIRSVVVLCLLAPLACAPTIDLRAGDTSLMAAIKTALLNDPTIDGTRIRVRVDAGVVTLGGTQATAEAAARAVELVRGVSGVRSVQGDVRVEATSFEER